jgi:peptide/nickel transport system substrate-binding protein
MALFALLVVLLAMACSGGEKTAAPAQQPANPAAAAPAAAPQPPATAPKPAAPAAPKPVTAPVVQVKNFIPGAGSPPKYGGILNSGLRNDPRAAWDPMKTDNYDLTLAANPITGYGNLVRACRETVYQICPGLAESWEANSDFTVWTFKVRDNVLWHDGTKFTVEDTKFWLDLSYFGIKVGEKSRGPNWYKASIGPIQKAEIVDGNKVRITLTRRSPQYLFGLGEPRATIAHPKHLAQARIDQGEVDIAPLDFGNIGSGPYKFLSWDRGVRVQVRKFDQYWEKDERGNRMPYLDGIDLFVMRDAGTFDAAFRSGRLDAGPRAAPYYLSPERKPAYVKEMGDKVWYADIGSPANGWSFNVLKPGPLQDVRVRKALSLWMDHREFITAVHGFGFMGLTMNPSNPIATPASEFFTWPGINPATKEKDRAEAKRILAEAGYANGFKINIVLPAPRWTVYGEFLAGHFKPLGVDLELKLTDDAGYAGGRLTLDYDTQYGGTYGWVIPEPMDQDLGTQGVSKASRAKHSDQKVDEYFVRLNNAASFEERTKIWREFERYYYFEQAYAVAVGGQISVVPYRSYVKGVVIPPERVQEYLDFATVWMDK